MQVAEWLGRRLKRPYARKFIPTENDLQVPSSHPFPPSSPRPSTDWSTVHSAVQGCRGPRRHRGYC